MKRTWVRLQVAMVTGLLSGPAAAATFFGIESCGSNSAPCDAVNTFVRNGGSIAPAFLFSMEANGSGFTNHGAITLNAVAIDADGLAMRSDGALYAFELIETVSQSGNEILPVVTGSRLLSLGMGSTAASVVGATTLVGREIRGAVFDVRDNLWALDAAANEVLRVDVVTGGVVAGTVRGLTHLGAPFDLGTTTDLAIRADGKAIVSNGGNVYQLALGLGSLTSLFSNAGVAYAGLAFDPAAPATMLTLDVTGSDDVLSLDTSLGMPTPANVLLDIIPTNNAGRGDLASLTVVPLPATLPFLGSAIAALAGFRFYARRGAPA